MLRHNSHRLLPILLLISVGISAFTYLYLSFPGVPGNNPDFPLGWWGGWFDQGEYIKATRDIAGGAFEPEAHLYPPLYPALAVPFLIFSDQHPYLPLSLLLLVGYLSAFAITFGAQTTRWIAVAAAVLGLFQAQILMLQWVIPWTSSLAAALEMGALLLFHRFLARRHDPGWTGPSRILNAALCGTAVGLLAPTRPVDFLAFSPLLMIYGGIVLKDWVIEPQGAGRGAPLAFGLAAVVSALPVLMYLTFNTWLFGTPLGGYFEFAQEAGGGAAFANIFNRSYSHLIDAAAFYAEPKADWISGLPILLICLCFAPVMLVSGPLFLRVVALLALLHLSLIYTYADAVPTGQFRYYNIHYIKWMYPVLPIFPLYFAAAILRTRERTRIHAAVNLGIGFVLVALVFSVTPIYHTYSVTNVATPDKETVELQFDKVVAVDFLDIPYLSTYIGGYPLRQQKVTINGGTELKPITEVRVTPRRGGVRVLFTETTALGSARISLSGIGNLGALEDATVIAGRVSLGLRFPWSEEPDLPYLPPANIKTGALHDVGTEPGVIRYFTEGWSGAETWGRWMDQPSAWLTFTLPGDAPDGLTLVLEGQAFLASVQPTVVMDVWINDVMARTISLDSAGVHRFSFPLPDARHPTGTPVFVELRARTVASPKDAGISGDDRELSFGLVRFGVLP